MNDPLAHLSGYGVLIWLDDLSRVRLTTGSLAGRGQVAGVITDPGIFAQATPGSGACSPQVRDLAARDAS
jgi:transaldolase